MGVSQGLLGGKGFGSNEKQGRFRVEAFEGFSQVGSIDVGYEMNPQPLLSIGLERLGDHQRT